MSILVKVQKLIALAASDNESEARNAAHAACKLIREHQLVLSEKQIDFGFVPPGNTPSWSRPKKSEKSSRDNTPFWSRETKTQVKPPPRQEDDFSSFNEPPSGASFKRVILKSKYSGVCKECGSPFEPGDRVAWMRGHGSIHESCYIHEAAWGNES